MLSLDELDGANPKMTYGPVLSTAGYYPFARTLLIFIIELSIPKVLRHQPHRPQLLPPEPTTMIARKLSFGTISISSRISLICTSNGLRQI